MEIIVVAGQAHSVGKTTLTSLIIANLPGRIGAIKTSIHKVDERIISAAPEVVSEPGTDTAYFEKSGAAKVVYLLCNYAELKESLAQAMELVGEVDYLLLEGNSVLDYVNPALTFYLARASYPTKPSAEKAEARADVIVDSDELQAFLQRRQEPLPFKINQRKIPCYKAHLLAKALGVSIATIGERCNESGVKVSHCQLGLF